MGNDTRQDSQKFVESMLGSIEKKEVPMPKDKRRELTEDELENVERVMEQLKKGKLLRK